MKISAQAVAQKRRAKFMKNNKIMVGIVGGILFLLYNIIVFTFATDRTSVFWSAYLFTLLAFAIQVIVFMMLYKRNTTAHDMFFGIPLTTISILYFIVQIIAGTLFMVFSDISLRVTNISQIVIFAVYLILAISALIAKNTVENISEKTKERILFIKLLENDIVSMKNRVSDPALHTRLSSLSELIRYSDPMSHPSLSLLEQKISNKISLLSDKVEVVKADELNEMFDEIESLMADRNRKCKILK